MLFYFSLLFVGILVGLFAYLAPSFVAFHREHDKKLVILLVNFLAGWTIVGWIWCLMRALKDE